MFIKNYSWTVYGVLLVFLGACQSGSRTEDSQDTVVQQPLSDKNGPLLFERVKVSGEKDTISFEIKERSIVKIKLSTPSDTGNIRISQIVMPNGEMDGPFGKDYEDSLQAPGVYNLIIAESMMAENPYTGEYQVEITVD